MGEAVVTAWTWRPRTSQVMVLLKYLPLGQSLTAIPGLPEGLWPGKGMDLMWKNSLQACALMAHHQMEKGDPHADV